MPTLPSPNPTNSFWLSSPSPFLLRHRTTPSLPPDADIVIIGSGITGASVARYLVEDGRAKGLSVVMVEAREAGWGATGRVGSWARLGLFFFFVLVFSYFKNML